MKKVIKIGLLIVAILGVAYAGSCVYVNFIGAKDDGSVKMPTADKARYAFSIVNTKNVLLSNSYDTYAKDQVIILHGYYEQLNNEYVYRNQDFVIDKTVFGPVNITVRKTSTPTGGTRK